ncbi:myosin heavy chain-related [Striga hermonthica]|uniref:Myosin heavy chain-related n=1 Tax=Striga hermonthica TaxID=68872 RepID=A0A9N7N4P6_STRHE|nr:myosin heavy chain-related [Striga hermonthica]
MAHHTARLSIAILSLLSICAGPSYSDDTAYAKSLLKFKQSLTDTSFALDSWREPVENSLCTRNKPNWAGLLCSNGSLIGLRLENMGLRGEIDLGPLTELPLLTLSFMHNNLSGSFPSGLRRLGKLRSLFLANNGFGGEIPNDSFDGMRSMRRIVLLRSTIENLEYQIVEKNGEMKEKDAVIADMEKLIKEKSDSLVTLKGEISSLQENGNSDADVQLGKSHARIGELEKQVEKLTKDLEVKIKEKDQLEARLTEAEKRASELNTKVNSLQKIIDNQKSKLQKTERALQIAEEEMMNTKFEVASKTKELMEVHGAWFPPWLAAHLIRYQAHLKTNWNIHGKPTFELLMQKAVEKKAQVEDLAGPHVKAMKTKLAPVVKEKWTVVASNVQPHVQTLTTKSIEIYKSSKNALSAHITRVLELVDPYFQDLRKISNPYIDRVADAARPHVDKLRAVLKPYTEKGARVSVKLLESAEIYHHRVQHKVEEKLKSHELTVPLATKELVWFSASALLALPFIFLMKICSAIFCRKAPRPTQNVNRDRGKAN